MKYVYLLRDNRAFWEEVKAHLWSINASIVEYRDSASFSMENFSEKPPCLFIIGGRNSDRLLNFQFRNYGIVIIDESGPQGEIAPSSLNPKWVNTQWPLPKSAFLQLTGELIDLSERKAFRTLIRLFPEGETASCLGQSVDFSLTGICFESGRPFAVDDLLEISFSPPGDGDGVTLKCRVVRKPKEGVPARYGARFLDLTPPLHKDLKAFIADK